jgi:hypothetical protein
VIDVLISENESDRHAIRNQTALFRYVFRGDCQLAEETLGDLYRYSMIAPAAGQTIVCMLDPEGKEITEAEIEEVLRQEAILRMHQTNS